MDHPLVCLLTQDPQLSARLGRMCDAVGVRWHAWAADGAGDPASSARRHPGVALVLLGAECTASIREPRRSGPGPVPGRDPVRHAGAALVIVASEPVAERVWRYAVAVGAEQVVVLPDAEPWLLDRVLAVHGVGGERGPMISVIGGRGGAGASVLAASLALTAARRCAPVLLVDADPLGCGLDLLLAAAELPGLRWPELAHTRGRVDGAAVLAGLPAADGVAVLTGGVLAPTRAEAVIDALTGHVNLTVVDLPRGGLIDPDREPGPGPSLAEPAWQAVLTRSVLTLLVVPAEVTATAAALRVRDRLRGRAHDLRVVVRGRAGRGLDAELVADALDLPLAGWLRPEPGLAAALDRGEPPMVRGHGPLARFTAAVLDSVIG